MGKVAMMQRLQALMTRLVIILVLIAAFVTPQGADLTNMASSTTSGVREITSITKDSLPSRVSRREAMTKSSSPSVRSTPLPAVDPLDVPTDIHTHKIKVAICLTGQLLRLELLSKIRNFIVFNAMSKGHKMDTFVLLDNEKEEAKQTYWRFDYASESLYRNFTAKKLRMYMEKHIGESLTSLQSLNHHYHFPHLKPHPASMIVRVRMQPPAQSNFSVINGKVPVDIKTGPINGPRVEGDEEPAEARFQNNMRWMAGLRECVKWVQATEQHQGWFYDLVVRLRDDSYVFGPWLLDPEKYKGAFVTAQIASNFGVNDHNFVIDRYFADRILRGITEDYYFNETLDGRTWINPEHRIYEIARWNNVPFRLNSVCEMPLVPLRGKKSNTTWRIHPSYKDNLLEDCNPIKEEEVDDDIDDDDDEQVEEANGKKTKKDKEKEKGKDKEKDKKSGKDPKALRRRRRFLRRAPTGIVVEGEAVETRRNSGSTANRRRLADSNPKQKTIFGSIFGKQSDSKDGKGGKEETATEEAEEEEDEQEDDDANKIIGPAQSLVDMLAQKGLKSCCPDQWIHMLESEEAKIFV